MKKVSLICVCVFIASTGLTQSLKLVVPIGHTQDITSLAVSPDDKLILSGGADNTIHLWSADAGRLLKTYRGHQGPVTSLVFSSSGKYFLSIDERGSGFIRDLNTGNVLDSVKVDNGNQFHYAIRKDVFCWIGEDSELNLWSAGQAKKVMAPKKKFYKAALSPDGKYLLAMGETTSDRYWGDGYEFIPPVEVYLFNLSTGTNVMLRKAKVSRGTQLGFTPDGSLALVGDEGNALFAYSTVTAKISSTASQGIWLDYFEVSKEGLVKLNCYDGLRLWNPIKKTIQSFKVSDNFRFGKQGDGLYELGALMTLRERDSLRNTSYWLAEAARPLDWNNNLYSIPVKAWRFAEPVEKFQLKKKAKVAYWNDNSSSEPLLLPASVACRFRTKNWLVRGVDNTLLLTNLETGKTIKELRGLLVNAPDELSFSSDRQMMAFRDKSIRIWNFNQSKLLTIESDSNSVYSIVDLPQQPRMILIGGNGKIEFRQAESGNLVYTLLSNDSRPFKQVKSIIISPDQQFLLWKDESNRHYARKINWKNLEWYSYQTLTDSLQVSYEAVPKGSSNYSSFQFVGTPPMEYFFFPNQKDLYSVMDMKSRQYFNTVSFYKQPLNQKLANFQLSKSEGYYSTDPGGFSFNAIKKVSWSMNGDVALVITEDNEWSRRRYELHLLDMKKEKGYSNWYRATSQTLGFLPLTGAVHPNALWFAVTGERGNDIRTFLVDGKDPRKSFSGHNDIVTSLAFSSDGKWLASGSADNTIKIWDSESRQELATLLTLSKQDWVVVHPSGLFDATPGAMSYLYFSSGDETIGLEQLKDRFYEPNLLKKIFNGEVLRTVSGLDQIDLYPTIHTTLDTVNARLIVKLVDQGGGIGKTSVIINGKEAIEDIRTLTTSNTVAQSKGAITVSIDLSKFKTLVWGKLNYIGVKAFNGKGYLASPSEKIYYSAPQKEQFLQAYEPGLYCLVVGVSDYANDDLDLKYSSKDAQDFSKAVSAAGSRLFGSRSQVTLLSSDESDVASKPTKENINRRLKEISEKAKVDDLVILYFSGHGTNTSGDDADFLYLTADARGFTFADPAIRQSTTLSSTELTEFMKTIAAKKFVLIFDACASGRMVENMLAKRDVPANTLRAMERMKDRTGTYILSGCAADAVSYEASQFGQGLLTYSLLSGMKGAALRENKFVDVLKLFQYAKEEVPKLAENVGGIQEPKVFSPYGGESFDIGLLEDSDKKLIPLTEAKPFFVRTSFQNEVKMRDDLGLSKLVDQSLAEQSHLGKSSTLIFIDAQEFPGAFTIYGRYLIENESTKLSVTVFKNDVQVSAFNKVVNTTDPTQLVKEIQEVVSSLLNRKGE